MRLHEAERVAASFSAAAHSLTAVKPQLQGKLTRATGLLLEATGCRFPIGTHCSIDSANGGIDAEVVGFNADRSYLMPIDHIVGASPGGRVVPQNKRIQVALGDALLGRVIDGRGRPIDNKGPILADHYRPLTSTPPDPLAREPIKEHFDVGVRVINALLSVGRGQRLGLFAGSGVGKSELLGMMTRNCVADVVVIGLIGERGREVRTFIEKTLAAADRSRTVVVAVPADKTAMQRVHGALLASTVAEYFRDQGKHVLLLMDSLSRFAQAHREIGLAIGEPPATRGYPPTVFQRIPELVERAGVGKQGSITALYTVLAEMDDINDPVVDSARSVLDGHIVLSRQIAESGLYPSVDLEASVSRVMNDLVDAEHRQRALRIRELCSVYSQNKEMINLGLYKQGTDSEVDQAVHISPIIRNFIRQDIDESVNFDTAAAQLASIFEAQASGHD